KKKRSTKTSETLPVRARRSSSNRNNLSITCPSRNAPRHIGEGRFCFGMLRLPHEKDSHMVHPPAPGPIQQHVQCSVAGRRREETRRHVEAGFQPAAPR